MEGFETAAIALEDVTRRFGSTHVLHGITLAVHEGEFVALLGPSGCGKSTTLRIMAGLDRPDGGRVCMRGRDVRGETASERNVAMVFQSYALYPHLTVGQNIALPLAMRGMTRLERTPPLDRLLPRARARRADHTERVRQVARMLGIEELLERKPGALSGGQKQRAAVGRALVRDPSVFLLDEPLSNLDARLRVQMRAELTALHRRTGKSFVYVTHDQAEAMSMSDRVAVMLGGRIEQEGPPRTLYERPATCAVAEFIGSTPINLVPVQVGGGRIQGSFAGLDIAGARLPARAHLGIRPEHLVPEPGGPLTARLETVEYLGSEIQLHLRLDDGTVLRGMAPGDWHPPAPGETVTVGVAPGRAHVFDAQTGQRVETAHERAAA
jgi:multiple sugar transport system ATP-binding protein